MIRTQLPRRWAGREGAVSFRGPRYFPRLADRLLLNRHAASLRCNLFQFSVHLRRERTGRRAPGAVSLECRP